jgi:hypothetical protein
MDVKAIVKKKVPSGAGTPTGTNENGYAVILAKDGIYVNYRWRKFPDELPPESGRYLVYAKSGYVTTLDYSQRHRAWNAFDFEAAPSCPLVVTHWMPLPPLPEEVDEP